MIGLFTNPGVSGKPDFVNKRLVGWIELSGARCVAIDYKTSWLKDELDKVDGVVMGGGFVESDVTHTEEQRAALFDSYAATYAYANKRNKRGRFAIFAICLGMEMTMMLQMGTRWFHDLDKVVAVQASTLHVSPTSRMAKAFTPMLCAMRNKKCVVQNHSMALLANRRKEISPFRVSSLDGSHINAMEHPFYPYYGVMFHPEKAWNALSEKVALKMSIFFKEECTNKNDSSTMRHVRQTTRGQIPVLRQHRTLRKRGERGRASRQVLYGRRIFQKDD
jgi:anthranilate/para-aminobenzoate synthase component II